jgi:hypothetical protein
MLICLALERLLPKRVLLYCGDGLSGVDRYFFTTCLTFMGVQLSREQSGVSFVVANIPEIAVWTSVCL